MIRPTTLECSSRGDSRFSALTAGLTIAGVQDSIEGHYQKAKRFGSAPPPQSWRAGKGRRPTHFEFLERPIPLEYSRGFYDLLWIKYLDTHPELVAYAAQFTDFHDVFARPGRVSQAESIRQYLHDGRTTMLRRPDIVAVCTILRSPAIAPPSTNGWSMTPT